MKKAWQYTAEKSSPKPPFFQSYNEKTRRKQGIQEHYLKLIKPLHSLHGVKDLPDGDSVR